MFEKLSENLDLLMTRNRLTATKVASKTGIPASTIKKIRSQAITNPTLATLIPLANFFTLSLEQMIYGDLLDLSFRIENTKPKVNYLPMISWRDAIHWPHIESHANYSFVISENNFTSNAFALRIESNDWKLFASGSVLLIEPEVQTKSRDYVLVFKENNAEPVLKQFIQEDETNWLRSINVPDNIMPLTNAFRIIGVVVEYRNIFKKLPLDQKPEN